MAPHQLDARVIATLRTVVAGVASFDCRFVRTRWFAEDALWLEPQPAEPFRQLTIGVWRAFSAYPPYGGAYEDVVPHLTIGESRVGGLAAVQRAEVVVQPGLPVWARIDRALLIAGTDAPNSWRVLHELPLASA